MSRRISQRSPGWERAGGSRDQEGRRLCRWCGEPVPRGRLTFCGDGCVHQYLLRSDPAYVRRRVFDRDRGVCASCGVDTERPEDRDRLRADLGYRGTIHLWEADHIVAVADGGGGCGLEGYQTLCCLCHHRKTATMARRRAAERRGQVMMPLGLEGGAS